MKSPCSPSESWPSGYKLGQSNVMVMTMMPKCFHVDIFYFDILQSLKQRNACYLSLCEFTFRRLLLSPRGLNFIDICNMLIIFLLLLIVLINESVMIGVNPLAHLFAVEVFFSKKLLLTWRCESRDHNLITVLLLIVLLIHCCNGDTSSQWEIAIFGHWGSETPESIELKFGMIDYVQHTTPHAEIDTRRFRGIGCG